MQCFWYFKAIKTVIFNHFKSVLTIKKQWFDSFNWNISLLFCILRVNFSHFACQATIDWLSVQTFNEKIKNLRWIEICFFSNEKFFHSIAVIIYPSSFINLSFSFATAKSFFNTSFLIWLTISLSTFFEISLINIFTE